jgi:N6-L-threonylcarbamoyladenine synthase
MGHVLSCRLDADFDFEFPVVCLSVSGGHNELYLLHSFENIELLGQSLDDAAGEAYDKVAKMLGLKYPGGPEISRIAESGDPYKYKLPNPLAKQAFNFSFSGLKTNVKYLIEKLRSQDGLSLEELTPDLAASFQQTINYNLSSKLVNAAKEFSAKQVHLVGGVSANNDLRAQITSQLPANMSFKHPKKLSYCTDNAAMIAAAAYFVCKSNYIQAGKAVTPGNS